MNLFINFINLCSRLIPRIHSNIGLGSFKYDEYTVQTLTLSTPAEVQRHFLFNNIQKKSNLHSCKFKYFYDTLQYSQIVIFLMLLLNINISSKPAFQSIAHFIKVYKYI
jgi:hypothetical protein